ncbi:hypothetical protein J437_LFUL006971 [Ladona fulva]|uniref:HTH psq-type domain-containing protein n=1 Tax=Ladona fulva TaxID=123851 RepID=A0A8K0NZD0_LADFU|nr:hypothetical protein J437_LFUL006971 [Ladona fulva]
MVRNYKRKTERQKWSQDEMASAIQEVIEGRMGYSAASQAFSVPRTTLIDRIRNSFSEEQERELVEYTLLMEHRLFGLTLFDLRPSMISLKEMASTIPSTKSRKLLVQTGFMGFLRDVLK